MFSAVESFSNFLHFQKLEEYGKYLHFIHNWIVQSLDTGTYKNHINQITIIAIMHAEIRNTALGINGKKVLKQIPDQSSSFQEKITIINKLVTEYP